jgi:hypothetical protein
MTAAQQTEGAGMGVNVTWEQDGAAKITFPFNRKLIEALKAAIPARSRTYDPTSRAWTIWEPYAQEAVRLAHLHFSSGTRSTSGTRSKSRSRRPAAPVPLDVERAYRVLHLRADAPDGLIDAAYRYLAKSAHPDRGGSDAAMQRLNSAVELLRQQRVAAS